MKKYLSIGLLLASAALTPAFASGALSNYGYPGGGGGYVETRVEQWEERLERLLAYQASGVQYYGNSKVPIANAIKKTQRQLEMYRAAEASGNPYPPVAGEGGAEPPAKPDGYVEPAPAVAAPVTETPAPEAPTAEKPDTETPAETPDTEAPSNVPDTESPAETPDAGSGEVAP